MYSLYVVCQMGIFLCVKLRGEKTRLREARF